MLRKFECGITGTVERDEDPINPREEWDNVGTMFCKHRNYILGDKDAKRPESLKGLIVLPLYLYDHSGITMSTSQFSCTWDSGQVGIIYVEKGFEDMSDEDLVRRLKAEVVEYDNFLTGNCFGYTIEDSEGEVLDSCWGYLGDEEYCETEMKNSGEYYVNMVKAEIAEQTYEEVNG